MKNDSHAWSGMLTASIAVDLGALVGITTWHPVSAVYVALVTAGASTAPDLDQPGSAPSRSFGPLSMQLARFLAWLGAREQARTRTEEDYRDLDGHRTITHAWPAWVSMGAVIGAVCLLVGDRAVVFTGYVFCSLALRSMLGPRGAAPGARAVLRAGADLVGLLRVVPIVGRLAVLLSRALKLLARHAGRWEWLCTNLAAGALAVVGAASAPSSGLEHLGPVLGVAIAVGMCCHCLGDCPTASGCPIGAPLKIRGQRWYRVRIGRGFRVGGEVEARWQSILILGAVAALSLTVPAVRQAAGEALDALTSAVLASPGSRALSVRE